MPDHFFLKNLSPRKLFQNAKKMAHLFSVQKKSAEKPEKKGQKWFKKRTNFDSWAQKMFGFPRLFKRSPRVAKRDGIIERIPFTLYETILILSIFD
jgi:hypothetical protein